MCDVSETKDRGDERIREKRQQREALQRSDPELGRLASEHKHVEFFKKILPLLRPLQYYIQRRLRIAYLTDEIRTPVATSGDILDEAVLHAYENYDQRPSDMTLDQWLYQIANEKLQNYVSTRKSKERRRKSLEKLTRSELGSLEEMPITADVEGEPWQPEDLDDSEYFRREFVATADPDDPDQRLAREEELRPIFQALCRMPEQDRVVFELYILEGFSKEEVGRILQIPPDQVPKIAGRARATLREEANAMRHHRMETRKRAS
jgi:RNA polymerase sigma factor (sigma-70 family)